MADASKKNPVEERLMWLADRWVSFREDPEKRLLIWRAEPNALRFFQCFFEVQKHETDYTVGDLFIVFDAPFDNALQYSRELKETLAGQYEASREDLVQQGIAPDWQFNPRDYPNSAAGFVSSMRSFGSQHHEHIGHLVAVLMPTLVADSDHLASWLLAVLKSNPPERMRFVVIDSLEAPQFSRLEQAGHAMIQFDTPNIDALTTAQETFAQESAAGPAGVFRNMLIGLMTLVEKGSAEQVKIKAVDALKFARNEKWPDQEVVVAMLVAGAMLKEKQFEEALKGYRYACKTAGKATASGHPAGQQMELQSWFGEASVHLAAGDLEEAVKSYDRAAVLAQQIPNLILGIEAFRMGAFCLARLKDTESAVQKGWHALSLGEKLKPDVRAMTTLPIAAVDLLRTIDPQRIEHMEHIKFRQKKQEDAIRQRADQQAAELETSEDQQMFDAVEAELETAMDQARQWSAQRVGALAADGDKPFKQVAAKAQELLGASWLQDTLVAVPDQTAPAGDTVP